MSAHTPGPWAVFGSSREYHVCMEQMPHIRVCFLTTDGPNFENARLIAAAPDLADALGALGVIGAGYCFCSENRDPEKSEHQPECRDARAALAKAGL